MIRSMGHEALGGTPSVTTMETLHDPILFAISAANNCSVLDPTPKRVCGPGLCQIREMADWLSEAEKFSHGPKKKLVVLSAQVRKTPRASKVSKVKFRFVSQNRSGGKGSVTVMVVAHTPMFPDVSLTLRSTMVLPKEYGPDGRERFARLQSMLSTTTNETSGNKTSLMSKSVRGMEKLRQETITGGSVS